MQLVSDTLTSNTKTNQKKHKVGNNITDLDRHQNLHSYDSILGPRSENQTYQTGGLQHRYGHTYTRG